MTERVYNVFELESMCGALETQLRRERQSYRDLLSKLPKCDICHESLATVSAGENTCDACLEELVSESKQLGSQRTTASELGAVDLPWAEHVRGVK